jgi:hypothetical protein
METLAMQITNQVQMIRFDCVRVRIEILVIDERGQISTLKQIMQTHFIVGLD